MLDAPRGRDGEFCSSYSQAKLDEFPWSARGLEKPTLTIFSKWGMVVCKRGLDREGQRKAIKKYVIILDEAKNDIIAQTEAIAGVLNDSFIGSNLFFDLYRQFAIKYDITISMYAETIISKRKQTPSLQKGKIYAYLPRPDKNPNDIKIGFTEGDPYKRMHDETRNARSEMPKMIGWYYGTHADEQRLLKLYKEYLVKLGNKELVRFPDALVGIEAMRAEITAHTGTLD